MIAPEQLEPMGSVCTRAQVMNEGGLELIFLEQLKIRIGGAVVIVDALLCPGPHSGYRTRLFLSQPFPQKAGNWTVHQLLARTWHTWSWQGVPADQPLLQMLMCHLDALR